MDRSGQQLRIQGVSNGWSIHQDRRNVPMNLDINVLHANLRVESWEEYYSSIMPQSAAIEKQSPPEPPLKLASQLRAETPSDKSAVSATTAQ